MADSHRKTAQTNREKHGADFYSRIGAMGGGTKTNKPKGFAAMDPEKVRAAARKGGSISKRT